MKEMNFSQAIDDAIAQAMGEDSSVIVFGEDIQLLRRNLLVRFGPKRVLNTPISESAFLGAGVAAAMAGLKPVVEFYMVDFLGVAMDALINHAAKLETFSGGKWRAPLVVRAPCGGGYGDGGQHEQSLWGWLAHIPGISVLVPSTPADAGGLMYGSLLHDGPVIFLEHKLLSEYHLEYLGSGGRKTVQYDIPEVGRRGPVPSKWEPVPFGKSVYRRQGTDITIASEDVSVTGRMLVVDEDYESFGLSGELAAVVSEMAIPYKFARVCTQTTIPYARHLEDAILPNVDRILAAAKKIMG
jgi:pyruvate dehydrogenase E1 component beta subunit